MTAQCQQRPTTYSLWLTNNCLPISECITDCAPRVMFFPWHPVCIFTTTANASGFHQWAIGSIISVFPHSVIDSVLTDIYFLMKIFKIFTLNVKQSCIICPLLCYSLLCIFWSLLVHDNLYIYLNAQYNVNIVKFCQPDKIYECKRNICRFECSSCVLPFLAWVLKNTQNTPVLPRSELDRRTTCWLIVILIFWRHFLHQ